MRCPSSSRHPCGCPDAARGRHLFSARAKRQTKTRRVSKVSCCLAHLLRSISSSANHAFSPRCSKIRQPRDRASPQFHLGNDHLGL
jgi:hypothetical protein